MLNFASLSSPTSTSAPLIEIINALSTVVVAAFAVVQCALMWSQHRKDLRTAFAALLVELSRMRSVADNWQWEDLVTLLREGLFDPDDLPPKDWGALLPLLGVLGPDSALLGGNAYAVAANTRLGGRHLQYLVGQMDRLQAGSSGPAVQSETAKIQAEVTLTQEMIREGAQGTVSLFQDALKSAPKWLVQEAERLERLERSHLTSKNAEAA